MAEVEFDPDIAKELAQRWHILELLAAAVPEGEAFRLAISDARAVEARLLLSAEPAQDVSPVMASGFPASSYPRGGVNFAGPPTTPAPVVPVGPAILASGGFCAPVDGPLPYDPSLIPTRDDPLAPEPAIPKHRRAYTDQDKAAAVALAMRTTARSAARALGIHETVIRGWVRKVVDAAGGPLPRGNRDVSTEYSDDASPGDEQDASLPGSADEPSPRGGSDGEDEPTPTERAKLLADVEAERATGTREWSSSPMTRTPVDHDVVRERSVDGA